ncbi:MAG: FAD-dependent oxidoreductase [Halobacteriovoraceae bacterium]|jgi:sulfide:quinone oxidoreductase|nr:FAD-dependent oxidoreductase [Halobacteriovoraceae bacterium]
MKTIAVLGGGVSGHTAAQFLKRKLGKNHRVIVVTPNAKWNWIPSNIWVGIGEMKKEDVTFELAPVYKKMNIEYLQAKAVSIHPNGQDKDNSPYVKIEYTGQGKVGQQEELKYDYLINATGPKLNFHKTEGIGPEHGNTVSVCTYDHAEHAFKEFNGIIEKLRRGEEATIVIGTGHGTCTCQGAAFEYLMNIDHKITSLGLKDKANIIYITNEARLGDFGVGGMHLKKGGYITHSKVFAESLFAEREIGWITGAHVEKVEKGTIHFEQLDGQKRSINYDFGMLIPPFSGVGITAVDNDGSDITEKLFKPNGFMIVDADYTGKEYKDWSAKDWPQTLQNPEWSNIFAVGIAFAPPHAISEPRKSVNGTPIAPTPPRTGMPSAMMGKAVALSICDMIKNNNTTPRHTACMSEMGAACVASTGSNLINGSAVSMTMFPIVQNFEKYPEHGRSLSLTFGEVGLAGHWIKTLLHYLFIYKAKAKPLWWLIPE